MTYNTFDRLRLLLLIASSIMLVVASVVGLWASTEALHASCQSLVLAVQWADAIDVPIDAAAWHKFDWCLRRFQDILP